MNSNITGKEARNDESDSRNIKSFLQNEQQQLANCVQLIAADMVEFDVQVSNNNENMNILRTPCHFMIPKRQRVKR